MSLSTISSFGLSIEHAELLKKTIAYESASLSPNTLRSYKSMYKKFQVWCEANGQSFLPTSAETIALYLSFLGETVSFSTLDSTIAAIEMVHEKSGMTIKGDRSLYRRVRRGIRRSHQNNQFVRQAKAISVLELKGVCCRFGNSLKEYRDRALLTVSFFGAFRRAEVVNLDISHLEFNEKGLIASILQSKTSDTKQVVYLSYTKDKDICPVRSLKEWIEQAAIKDGAIFRSLLKGNKVGRRLSGHAVSDIIKRHFGKGYSGHSTRRGLITASAENGTPMHVIKKHSRHKSADMVFRYIEESRGFEDSSVTILGV